jgi:hypothetical protein
MDQPRRGATTAVAVAITGYLLLQLVSDSMSSSSVRAAPAAASVTSKASEWIEPAAGDAAVGDDAGDAAPLLGDGTDAAAAAALLHRGPPRLQYSYCTS